MQENEKVELRSQSVAAEKTETLMSQPQDLPDGSRVLNGIYSHLATMVHAARNVQDLAKNLVNTVSLTEDEQGAIAHLDDRMGEIDAEITQDLLSSLAELGQKATEQDRLARQRQTNTAEAPRAPAPRAALDAANAALNDGIDLEPAREGSKDPK